MDTFKNQLKRGLTISAPMKKPKIKKPKPPRDILPIVIIFLFVLVVSGVAYLVYTHEEPEPEPSLVDVSHQNREIRQLNRRIGNINRCRFHCE